MATALPKLIGVIHLPALPGAPGAHGTHPAMALQNAGALAVQQARALAKAGFDGVIVENFGDAPFYKDRVPPETVAAMSVICAAVREAAPRARLGVNVLRNDGRAALAIAAATGFDFIRVNVLSGVAATDQGLVEGDAAALIRERDRLGAPIAILADAHVKHARSLSSENIGLAVEEIGLRAHADGVVVTGPTTGRPVDMDALREASESARHHGIPLFIGSGASPETLGSLRRLASGVIVGSAIRKDGKAGAPLDSRRLRAFVTAFRRAKTSSSLSSKRSRKKA